MLYAFIRIKSALNSHIHIFFVNKTENLIFFFNRKVLSLECNCLTINYFIPFELISMIKVQKRDWKISTTSLELLNLSSCWMFLMLIEIRFLQRNFPSYLDIFYYYIILIFLSRKTSFSGPFDIIINFHNYLSEFDRTRH